MTFDTVLLPIGRCGGEVPEHVTAAWSELPEHVTAAWSELPEHVTAAWSELPEHVTAAWSELPEHVTAAWSEWFVVVHVCRFTDSLCLWSRLLSVRPSHPSKGSS